MSSSSSSSSRSGSSSDVSAPEGYDSWREYLYRTHSSSSSSGSSSATASPPTPFQERRRRRITLARPSWQFSPIEWRASEVLAETPTFRQPEAVRKSPDDDFARESRRVGERLGFPTAHQRELARVIDSRERPDVFGFHPDPQSALRRIADFGAPVNSEDYGVDEEVSEILREELMEDERKRVGERERQIERALEREREKEEYNILKAEEQAEQKYKESLGDALNRRALKYAEADFSTDNLILSRKQEPRNLFQDEEEILVGGAPKPPESAGGGRAMTESERQTHRRRREREEPSYAERDEEGNLQMEEEEESDDKKNAGKRARRGGS